MTELEKRGVSKNKCVVKGLWESKLAASGTIDHTPRASQEAMLDARQRVMGGAAAPATGGGAPGAGAAGGGGAVAGSQLVITDPERLVPVQITIPAQPGNPQSQARALTVQAGFIFGRLFGSFLGLCSTH